MTDDGYDMPELFQDKSDEEIPPQPQQGAHNTWHTQGAYLCQVELVP